MIVIGYYGIMLVVLVSIPQSVLPSVVCQSVFSFPDSLSKCHWIFTKLDVCFDVEIWFGVANAQNRSIFDSYRPATR